MQASTTLTAPQIEAVLSASYRIANPREAWPQILPGLEKLAAQHPDNDWTIDGVREMLDDLDTFLLVDNDDPTGFAVVRFRPYPYNGEDIELFVYVAWHEGGDAIARFQPHFEEFARLGGAQYMRFYSRRPAWLRVAQRIGYQLRGIEYVKELPHVIR